MSPDQLSERIKAGLPGATVDVRDSTGGGDHFEGVVVWDGFEGQSLLDQQRAVYAALGDWMHHRIHAFSFRTFTPAAWALSRAR